MGLAATEAVAVAVAVAAMSVAGAVAAAGRHSQSGGAVPVPVAKILVSVPLHPACGSPKTPSPRWGGVL